MKKYLTEAAALRAISKSLKGKNSYFGIMGWLDKFKNSYVASVKRREDIPNDGKAAMIADAEAAHEQLRWAITFIHLTLALHYGSQGQNGRAK